jgi:hypothetical protein
MEKFMDSQKTSGFPQNRIRYQGSDLIFEFLDVGNPLVKPYGKFMVSPENLWFSTERY